MNHPITKTLLALGCVGALATSASAALPTMYTTGDFFVGFHQDPVGSNATSVVIDIGPITNFLTTQTFAINAGTTLSAQYGSGWANDSSVMFSLASTNGSNTNYVTSPGYAGPGSATDFGRLSTGNSNILRGKINAAGGEFTNNELNGNGIVEPNSDGASYASYQPGGVNSNSSTSYGFFSPTVEGNFGQGTSGVELDLIQLPSGLAGTPGNDLGYFTLSGDGNTLTFTPAVVPEPSAYAAMAVWGVLAFLGFRIKKARKSSTTELIA